MSLGNLLDFAHRPAPPRLPSRLLDDDSPIAMWLFDARSLQILWANRP